MNLTRFTLFVIVLFAPYFLMAQETVSDSSRTDSLKDSIVVVDSLKAGDEILDELTESQRKVMDMGRRLEEFKAARQLLPRKKLKRKSDLYLAEKSYPRTGHK